MIDRLQLAEALGRLDPRDREILDYSLRRRVPDEDLAELFGDTAGGVARLRAGAVERLSNDLGVQRGSDLGHMLKELLDSATWELVPSTGADSAPHAGRPVGVVGSPAPDPRPATVPAPAPRAQPPGQTTSTDAPEPTPGAERSPVLDMLANGEHGGYGDGPPARGGRLRRLAGGVAVTLAVLAPAGVVAALTSGDSSDSGASAPGAVASSTRSFEPQQDPVAEPFPTSPQSANQYPIALVRGRTVLYDRPRGKRLVRIAGKTEWSSPRVLAVVERRGEWLAVLAPELRNGEVGWIREGQADRLDSVAWSIHVDVSRRRLVVRRDGEDVKRFRIGVGRPDHPTPVGRFAVTDKLRVTDPASPYGCCVLALTGHQPKLPAGWPGGDRLAVHATRDASGLGEAVSLGCMRTDPSDAEWMMKTIPLGTPVFVAA